MIQVNAMGDACPIPVVKTKNAIKELNGAGARFILMTGRKPLKNKDFGSVFSYEHWMPSAGKRGIVPC